MLEDFRLKVFLKVVEAGSLTEAARSLGISQPAVSQNIAELERETGCKLFVRHRSGVELTERGRHFRSCAEQIMHWYSCASAGPSPAEEPIPVRTDNDSPAIELWSSEGDVHIIVRKK